MYQLLVCCVDYYCDLRINVHRFSWFTHTFSEFSVLCQTGLETGPCPLVLVHLCTIAKRSVEKWQANGFEWMSSSGHIVWWCFAKWSQYVPMTRKVQFRVLNELNQLLLTSISSPTPRIFLQVWVCSGPRAFTSHRHRTNRGRIASGGREVDMTGFTMCHNPHA